MLDKLGGTKFIFGILLTVCATAFVVLGKMTVTEWASFEEIVGSVYMAARVVETAVAK